MGVGIQILSDFAKVICGAMATQPTNSDDCRKPRGHEPKSEVLAAVHRGPGASLCPPEGQLVYKERRFMSAGYRNCSGLVKPHVLQRLVFLLRMP